jgi:autotransporter translocation and assembly factor TamB
LTDARLARDNRSREAPRSRARQVARNVLLGAGVVVVLLVLVVVVLATTPWGNERVRRIVVSRVNDRLTGTLHVERLRGNLFAGATLSGVAIVDSAKQPVFSATRVKVDYALLPLLRRQVVIERLVLDTVAMVFDKRPGQRWNFQALMRPSGATKDTSQHGTPPRLGEVVIHDGRFSWRRPWRPDSNLPADRRDAAIAAALGADARSRTVRVPGGYQRVLYYHDIDAVLPEVHLAHDGQPTSVRIGSLSMIAEPYRPPVINVKSLTGMIYASKDSLWWHDAMMTLPSSRVAGNGRIGFNRSGIAMQLTAAPLAFADFRWLNPKLPTDGGGRLSFALRSHGDTAEYAVSNTEVHYRDAVAAGQARVLRVHPPLGEATVMVRGADVTVSQLGTDLVRQLVPSAKVPRGGTVDGHLTLDGPLDALALNADLRYTDARTGTSRVTATGGIGFAHGVRARDLRVGLHPLHLALLDAFGVRAPVPGTVSGTTVVNGSARTGWDIQGDLTHVDRGATSRVSGTGRYRPAGRQIAADVALRPLALAIVNAFVPKADLRGSVTGRVRAEGTTGALRLSGTLRSTSNGGSITGSGTVSPAGKQTSYDVTTSLDAFNAHAFAPRAPVTSLTGTVAARGRGTSPATMDAVFRADLTRSRYDTFTVDRLLARGTVSNGMLHADTLFAALHGARASSTGTFGLVANREGALHFTLSVDSLGALRPWLGSGDTSRVAVASGRQGAVLDAARADSARRAEASRIMKLALGLPPGAELIVDTLVGIPRDSLAGSLVAEGTLRGNVKRLAGEADIHGRNLVVRGNAAARLDAHVSAGNTADGRPAAFRVRAESVQTGGRWFDAVSVVGSRRQNTIHADVRVRQDSHTSYAALGEYERPEKGVQRLHLDSLSARFDTLTWRLVHPGGVRLDHGSVAVDSIDLRSSAGGRLWANGAVPKEGAVDLRVGAEHVAVGTLLQALQREADATGLLDATATVHGTRAEPVIIADARLRDAAYHGTSAPDADFSMRYSDRRLTIGGAAHDSTGRQLAMLRALLPIDLALDSVSGSRRLAGPISADVVLDSLGLATLPLESRTVTGVHGVTVGEVHVRGTWQDPTYGGHLALRDGGFTLVPTGMTASGAVADVRLVGDTLRLDSLVAHARGTLRAAGTVDLTNRARPFVRANATLRNVRVMDAQRGLVDADGEMTVEGPLDAVHVTGRGEMLHGFVALKQFRKDLLRVKAPGALSTFAVWDTTTPPEVAARSATLRAQPRKFGLIVDLALQVDRGNYYRNKPDVSIGFHTDGDQELRAHLDTRSSDAWAIGFVRVGGGLAIFRARRFLPERGSLTFTPYTNAPGIVENLAEREVWEPGRGMLPLQFLTGGTSKAPAVGLEAGTLFPIRGRELNGYLTMGRAHTSLLQQSGSSLSGSASWSGQLAGETGALARRQQGATALGVVLHDIGTGATKEFNLDAFSVSPADVPTELVFGKTGGVRGALVEGGRFVTVDRYIGGEIRLTRGIPGARLSQQFDGGRYQLDIGIEPRFLFVGADDLGITHPTVRTGVGGVFLTRNWWW